VPVTESDVCSHGKKHCSADGSDIQECGFSQSESSWKWLGKKKCGKGCCNYARGTKTPMCMCFKPRTGVFGDEGTDGAVE
jgi:hypothetical protein